MLKHFLKICMSLLRKNMIRIYYFLSVTLDKDDSLDQQSIQTKQREAQVSNKFRYVIETVLYQPNILCRKFIPI